MFTVHHRFRLCRPLLAALSMVLALLVSTALGAGEVGSSQIHYFLPGSDLVPAPRDHGIDVFLQISQVDYYLQGELVVPSSEWGQLDVLYDAGHLTEVLFLNIVANPGESAQRWMVQNHPLTPSANPDDCCFRSVGFFDLASAFGAERGEELGGRQLPVQASVTDFPWTEPVLSGEVGIVSIQTVPTRDLINSGVPSGSEVLEAPVANPVTWAGLFELEVHVRNNMPNVVQERNFCGPGSAANSLHWLDAENEEITLTDTLEATQQELADAMGNENDGNWDDAQVEGKLEYIDDHDLPIEVHYTGGRNLPTMGNYMSPNGHGSARNDGEVTWEWLKQELDRGQDIEIMTRSHWVVLDGYIDLGGVHLLRYRDDPYQNGAATTEQQEDDIESRHVWTYFDSDGNSNIGNGEEEVLAAVAESPEEETAEIPPPPTDDWLITPEQASFEFQARITPAGGPAVLGTRVADCIPETMCLSGALAGRPEVFVKPIGPRPNGFLWIQISRFTPSEVEVWVRQLATGQINYYQLDPVGPFATDVCGLQDREAFLP